MSDIDIRDLAPGLPFGARVRGVDAGNVADPKIVRQLRDLFVNPG